jgi:hypothetical protein
VNPAETIERVPIHTDGDGVVRVAGTRVTLDTIVAAFDAGATAEEIAQQLLLHFPCRRVLRNRLLPAAQQRSFRLPSRASGTGCNRSRRGRAAVPPFGHTGTTDSPAQIGTFLRCNPLTNRCVRLCSHLRLDRT